jgi:hypothetical protein
MLVISASAWAAADSAADRDSAGRVWMNPSLVQLRCESQRLQLSFPDLDRISEGHLKVVEHYFANAAECGEVLAQFTEALSSLAQSGSKGLETKYKTFVRLYSYHLNYSESCNVSVCSAEVDDRLMITVELQLLGAKFSGNELISSTIRSETWPAGFCPPYRPDCDL